MKTRIHVNRHIIVSNKKNGTRKPVITCKTYKGNQYGTEVVLLGQDGLEAGRVVYRPDNPLNCGAVLWIETNNQIIIEK